MTVKELKTKLDKLGVEYPPKAKKPELEKLLADSERLKASESEQDEERLKPENEKPEEEEVTTVLADPDYLRPYQYKKVNGNPVVGGPLTDPDPGSKAATMKTYLLSQPRVRIFIPRVEGENPRVTLSVNLNGYRLDLPKQVYLELPLQVAEVIMESQKQQIQALQPYRVDRNKGTEEALS